MIKLGYEYFYSSSEAKISLKTICAVSIQRY